MKEVKEVVVDTNVPVVANGRNTHANEACQAACIKAIKSIWSGQRKRIVILDDKDEIMDEYQKI